MGNKPAWADLEVWALEAYSANSDLGAMTNEELALQVQAGNMAAFDRLVQQNKGALRNALRHDAMGYATGGNTAIGKEGSDFSLFDFLPDESARKAMRAVEENDFRRYTRRLLESALASLPQEESDAIRRHYMEGIPQADVAQETGVSPTSICRRIKKGLAALRADPQLQPIRME